MINQLFISINIISTCAQKALICLLEVGDPSKCSCVPMGTQQGSPKIAIFRTAWNAPRKRTWKVNSLLWSPRWRYWLGHPPGLVPTRYLGSQGYNGPCFLFWFSFYCMLESLLDSFQSFNHFSSVHHLALNSQVDISNGNRRRIRTVS